jgi:leader peptidase (prepilin peptidase)/N-methyltransferase
MIKVIIVGIWLAILGWIDFKHKEIPMWLVMLGGVIGIGFCIWEGRSIEGIMLSSLPGILTLVFSRLTKEVIGYGDGIVMGILGLFWKIGQLLSIGMTAFVLAGMVALVLLVVFQKKGSSRMPFIPFLCVAYGIDIWARFGEGIL